MRNWMGRRWVGRCRVLSVVTANEAGSGNQATRPQPGAVWAVSKGQSCEATHMVRTGGRMSTENQVPASQRKHFQDLGNGAKTCTRHSGLQVALSRIKTVFFSTSNAYIHEKLYARLPLNVREPHRCRETEMACRMAPQPIISRAVGICGRLIAYRQFRQL